jgi:hypothetical protein
MQYTGRCKNDYNVAVERQIAQNAQFYSPFVEFTKLPTVVLRKAHV